VGVSTPSRSNSTARQAARLCGVVPCSVTHPWCQLLAVRRIRSALIEAEIAARSPPDRHDLLAPRLESLDEASPDEARGTADHHSPGHAARASGSADHRRTEGVQTDAAEGEYL